jgi:hypothetical protein
MWKLSESISDGMQEGRFPCTHVAERAKHIATPKKKVEKTTISDVVAEPYLGCKE